MKKGKGTKRMSNKQQDPQGGQQQQSDTQAQQDQKQSGRTQTPAAKSQPQQQAQPVLPYQPNPVDISYISFSDAMEEAITAVTASLHTKEHQEQEPFWRLAPNGSLREVVTAALKCCAAFGWGFMYDPQAKSFAVAPLQPHIAALLNAVTEELHGLRNARLSALGWSHGDIFSAQDMQTPTFNSIDQLDQPQYNVISNCVQGIFKTMYGVGLNCVESSVLQEDAIDVLYNPKIDGIGVANSQSQVATAGAGQQIAPQVRRITVSDAQRDRLEQVQPAGAPSGATTAASESPAPQVQQKDVDAPDYEKDGTGDQQKQ